MSSFPMANLLDRAIEALTRADAAALSGILVDCSRAEMPGSAEEFSRALARQAAFEKVLEQTAQNLRILSSASSDFRYRRKRDGNS